MRFRSASTAFCLVLGLSTLVPAAAAAQAPDGIAANTAICSGDGVSGKRVQLVYARAAGDTDRFAEMQPRIQAWADQIDGAVLEAAQRTGGVRHVRFAHHANCRPTVVNATVPASEINDGVKVAEALKRLGHNRTDRKYLVFYQGTHACGLGWNEPGGDDRPGSDNPLNSGPGWATLDEGCWAWNVAAHELLHSLGAVQGSAPHATTGGHCWDDQDIMCYDDGGLPPGGLKEECPKAFGDIIDCNNDDYFSTAPAAGTYLAGHWNVANSQFLTASGPGAPVYTGTREVRTARSGATAYVTKYQLPDGRWTAKAKIVTNSGSPFYSSVLAARTPAGVRYIPPAGVPRGTAAYVTVDASTSIDFKLCEGNASAKGGCTATWW
ncbi:hypothetical protein [Actinokineospora sp. UTMC 2448]|uniref:hypothetical protein n=1 Tax=Actinokineospora sp. UTMC 2448 TaxID=2268449 RepID=UPI002164A1EC|nr:hypothetical protein [Actinokineospora sp. UTMC 2448]UVS78708.1 hypothetical protein Actkin_02444 [Actinokineospora sp. UTMC 2448]